MWGSFWANLGPPLRTAPAKDKLKFPQTSVRPIGQFKWSRRPSQKTYATVLDRVQTHMLAILFPTAVLLDEPAADFFRRRSVNAGRLASRSGRWSRDWAHAVIRWHDYVARGNDARVWCKHIDEHRSGAWLQQRREAAHLPAPEIHRPDV